MKPIIQRLIDKIEGMGTYAHCILIMLLGMFMLAIVYRILH